LDKIIATFEAVAYCGHRLRLDCFIFIRKATHHHPEYPWTVHDKTCRNNVIQDVSEMEIVNSVMKTGFFFDTIDKRQKDRRGRFIQPPGATIPPTNQPLLLKGSSPSLEPDNHINLQCSVIRYENITLCPPCFLPCRPVIAVPSTCRAIH
jgi:hypothetical protein